MGTMIRTTVGSVRRAASAILAETNGGTPDIYTLTRRRSSGSVQIEYEDPITGEWCDAEVFYRMSGRHIPGDLESPEEFPEVDIIGAFCDGVPVKLSGPVTRAAEDKAFEAERDRIYDTEY